MLGFLENQSKFTFQYGITDYVRWSHYIQDSYMRCIVHTARIINEIDILALPRRHVIHQLCIEPSSSQIVRSSVVRASDRCTEGHRFNTCLGLRFFPCPMLVTCWSRHYCTSLCFYKETETLLLFPYADLWSLKNNNLYLIHVFLSPKSYYSQLNTVFVFRKLRNELASSYHAGECTKS